MDALALDLMPSHPPKSHEQRRGQSQVIAVLTSIVDLRQATDRLRLENLHGPFTISANMPHPAPKTLPSPHKPNVLSLTYQWLFDGQFSAGYQRKFENGIAWLIILSVMALVAENIAPIYVGHEWAFQVFDVLIVAIFTLEYLMRLATAPYDPEFSGKRLPRLRYAFSFYALIDLLAIAPFYVTGYFSADVEMMQALRMLRLMRIFKLSRYVVPAWQEFKTLHKDRGFRYKLFVC
jgi:hypothetical protein